MRRRWFPLFIFFFIGALLLAVRPAAGAEEKLESVVLQLKWFHQFQFAGYYAAQERGFYREAGFNVEIREGAPQTDAVKEVSSGRANFGISNSDLLIRKLRGDPVVVLAAIFQHSPLVIIATEASGIQHPQHMRGMRVGINRNTRDAELLAMLRNEGVLLTDIEPPVGGNFSFSMYYDGSADAGSAYLTNEPFFLEQKGIPFRLIRPLTYGVDFYGDCLFTSENEVARHPDRVRRFRQASLQGWEFALANPERMVDLIIDRYGSNKSRDHLRYEAEKMKELVLPKLVEIGHMNPGRWRHIAQTFMDLGMIKGEYDLDGFQFDPDPRPELSEVRRFLTILAIVAVAFGVGVICLLTFNRRLHREVQERKRAEKTLRFQAELLGQIQDLIVATDTEGRIQYVNDATFRVLQKPPEALIGQFVHGLDIYGSEISQKRVIEETMAHDRWRGRLEDSLPDGSPLLLETRTWVLRDAANNATGMVGVSTDITERVRMEQDLVAARNEAVAANRAKSAFLTHMSHELRTPLNGILGFAKILKGEVPQAQRDAARIIHQSGEHLLGLINDVLDLAKVEAGRIELAPKTFYFPRFLSEIAEIFRLRALGKGLSFELAAEVSELPGWVRSDERRLRQVLLNLLGNGLNFTESGGLTLRAEPVKDQVRLTVQDTGVGIPADLAERIFEPFFQVENRQSQPQGTGLGLAISRTLVRVLGGELRVESTPGAGSRFWFDLHLPPVPPGDFRPSAPGASGIIGVKGPMPAVLVVDDDFRNRLLFERILTSAGMVAATAGDGEGALVEARKQKPHAVIADLRMPGMDGYELIRRLRADPDFLDIPIIATSASVFEEDRRKCLKGGADRFLPKPVAAEQLLEALGGFLDLEWVYADAPEPETAAGQRRMEGIPEKTDLSILLELTETGDLSALEEKLAEIAADKPRFAPFTDRLTAMARKFEMNRIRHDLRERLK